MNLCGCNDYKGISQDEPTHDTKAPKNPVFPNQKKKLVPNPP
jgi:hypothetical protein